MKPGKTELRLNEGIEKRGALFAVLLDPDKLQSRLDSAAIRFRS